MRKARGTPLASFLIKVVPMEKEIIAIVDNWCPINFSHEPLQVRALRALLNANACVLDMNRVLHNERPIRPLTDYPIRKD